MKTKIALSLLCLCATSLALAQKTVSATGAVGVNAKWEAGDSKYWYIEEQRLGASFICDGIDEENDSKIQLGLKILKWGFGKQATNGSFSGTGDPFHSTSLFVESAGRALRLLRDYRPVAGGSAYADQVPSLATKLGRAGRWLMTTTVRTEGDRNNSPYTHRRWVLASALAQTADASGDVGLFAYANDYANKGISLQLSNGVNPELGGYDVEYQAAGVNYALNYLPLCSDPTLRQRTVVMISKALVWEGSRIDRDGKLNASGSTRIGVERNRDGSLKAPTMSVIASVFDRASANDNYQYFKAVANRIRKPYFIGSTQTISSLGAVTTNSRYDTGESTTIQIGLQRRGAEWIEAGIAREDDRLIQTGIRILKWGIAKQASDGSFPKNSSGDYYNAAQFMEGLGRAAVLLSRYQPVTYVPSQPYSTTATVFRDSMRKTVQWLLRPDVDQAGAKSDGAYSSHNWLLASGFAHAGFLDGNATYMTKAGTFVRKAIALQTTTGMCPENGRSNTDYQAIGVTYATRYYALSQDVALRQSVSNSVRLALNWEMDQLTSSFGVEGASSYEAIIVAFEDGYRITGDKLYLVTATRIDVNH